MLTHERLLELLHYDPITGNFTWRIDRRGHSRAGDLAGTVHRKGYRYVAVDGKKHAAHRLAFFYMNAEWPNGEIDHINLCRADNRWCNLRVATGAQNKANTSVRQDNTSGHLDFSPFSAFQGQFGGLKPA